jgi:DNA repair exonuclease SbcCD ATPase subunit
MNIVRLQAENIKRLVAFDFAPTGESIIKIGGRNAQGKSSVLDAVAYALGGSALIPSEPLRAGEITGHVTVDLGDYVVTRRFKREQAFPPGTNIVKKNDGTSVGVDAAGNPVEPTLGPTNSTLVVTNKDGAKYPTPQAMLDKLFALTSFNPLAFGDLKPREQRDLLAKIAGLSLDDLDKSKVAVAGERTMVNRDVKRLQDQLAGLPHYADAPAEEVSVVELTEQLEAVQAKDAAATEANKQLAEAHRLSAVTENRVLACKDDIKRLESELRTAQERLKAAVEAQATAQTVETSTISKLAKASAALIDSAPIRQAIKESGDVNAKVRANQNRVKVAAQLNIVVASAEALNLKLKDLEAQRAARLAAAKFPISGLALDEECVRYGGTPFDQLSTSEQLRISTAIGLALNPTVKVLLIPKGNVLDKQSLLMLGKMADEASAQVWIEWVAENAEGVSVFIEDGHVAG